MSDHNEPFVHPKAPVTKAFAGNRFRFVPCGYLPEGRMNTLIYVRYKSTKELSYDQPTKIVGCSDRWVHFDCVDREVLFTRDSLTLGGDRIFNPIGKGKKWDKAITVNIASVTGDDLAFDRFMINTHGFGENNLPRLRDPNCHATTGKLIMMDSGGFQIAHGALDFINPVDLAKTYTKNADEGVVLDLPARAIGDNTEILGHTSRIHKLNARVMSKHLPKDFRLGDVAHGLNLNLVDYYRKQANDEKIDYKFLCISGALRFNMVETIHRCLHIMSTQRKYEHYHILGVGNPPLLAALARLAYKLKAAGRRVLLTTDASSPIGFALKRTAYVQPAYYHALEPTRFGERMSSSGITPGSKISNAHRRFATSDQVTAALGGYLDFMHLYNSSAVQAPLIYSNQIQLSNYIMSMGVFAEHLDAKEYKELVTTQFHGTKHCVLLGVAIDYLEYAFEHGIDKAFKRFAVYMPTFTGSMSLRQYPSLAGEEGDEDETSEISKKRFMGVIKNFTEYHKTGKVPVQKNKFKETKSGNTLSLRA